MSELHKELVRRFIAEAINKGNLSNLDAFVHPSYVFRAPGGEQRHGPDGLSSYLAAFRSAFPDLRVRVDDMLGEGDKVMSCFTMTGTHQGELMGIAATGQHVTINGMLLSRFEQGKIIEEWEILDQFGLLQQLGGVSLPT